MSVYFSLFCYFRSYRYRLSKSFLLKSDPTMYPKSLVVSTYFHFDEKKILTKDDNLTLQMGADSARPEEKLRFWYILVIQWTRKNLTFPK